MLKTFQIDLPDPEQSLLVTRIEQDFLLAKASHQRWSERCASWLQKWECRVDPPAPGDEDKPNSVVPLLQWQTFNKLARDVQALIGEEAEITARATGPSDRGQVAKIGRWMTSRVFDQMEMLNPLIEFEFRRILNGWSCAYRPWYRREFDTLDENGQRKRVSDYEGPGFFPCEPDDIVVPPERGVQCIQDFSFVIRRVRVTVDDLQRGAGTLYSDDCATPEFVKEAIDWAQTGYNDYTVVGQDPVRQERELSEGVDYDSYMMGRRSLWMWEWYGKWRPLKGKQEGSENDLERREIFESDWVVRFIPGMRKIVGCQDLLELYPKMRKRRPFSESTLIKDGTYRPKGFGALLEDLEDDATANSRLFTAAGELSVWPIIFFKPGGGMKPGSIRLQPGMAIPTEDPSSVNIIKINPNVEYGIAKQQDTLSIAERVTGITDQSLGRAVDRPNAPRTATGQLALIEEGNIRAYLDATILREDFEEIISDIWDLDCEFVPQVEPGLFFRVTEEDANGLFDTKQGGAFMTPGEFGGRYDFRLKFATTVWARQQKKQETMQFYGAALQNPLCQQNPRALWQLLNLLAKEFNIDFEDIVPKPPDIDRPKRPDEEWAEMLEGQTVNVNPQDDDQAHITAHVAQLEDERKDPDRDAQAIGLGVKHILDHQQQMRTKMLMQTMVQNISQSLTPQPGQQLGQQMAQHLQMAQQAYGGQPPGMTPPGAPAGGDVPPPPPGVGSQAAPVPQNGML
jgi:hypothetical protein